MIFIQNLAGFVVAVEKSHEVFAPVIDEIFLDEDGVDQVDALVLAKIRNHDVTGVHQLARPRRGRSAEVALTHHESLLGLGEVHRYHVEVFDGEAEGFRVLDGGHVGGGGEGAEDVFSAHGFGRSEDAPETEKRVLGAATKLGYLQPYESISSSELRQDFAVIVPDMINPHFSNLLSHISRCAFESHVQMIVCNTLRSAATERDFVTRLIAGGVGGILYVCTPTCIDLIEKANYRLPVVIVGETEQDLNVSIIAADNYLSGYLLAEHIYGLGHRHIAYITPPINSVSVLRQQRLKGLESFFKEKGVGHFHVYEQTSYLVSTDDSYEIAMGEIQTRQILADHKDVTAIIGQGDLIAFGIYSALKAEGKRIPEDVSVAAFDNIEYGKHITPSLTTIDSKMVMRGKYGFEHLVKLMANSNANNADPLFVTYRPSLVARDSTAKPPGSRNKKD